MADPIITKIGDVSAYLDAVAHGFEGTRAEFGELLANSANYAQSAESAASAAIASAATATTKAGEATTAATAAQTAKTQTEAAASQALTDISTARSGAISAIQTEGATQTANATAQAQAAAASAATASTKASEASASATTATTKATEAAASATSAANAASAAQGVLESIPEDYSDLSEDVDQLKADLADVTNHAVKSAEQLISDKRTTDKVPYKYRASASGKSDRAYDMIVGGTVCFNQLAMLSADGWTATRCSMSVDGTTITMTTTGGDGLKYIQTAIIQNHKYFASAVVSTPEGQAIMYGDYSGATSTYSKRLAVSGGTTGNVRWIFNAEYANSNFRILFGTGAPSGTSGTIDKLQLFDLTAMFGTAIADHIYDLEQATVGAGVALFRQMFQNDYYPYNAGELVSVAGLSAHIMRDADDNIVGSYLLDSTLTLRGIPKLVDGKIEFDGDTYEANGIVTKRYAERVYQSGDESLVNAITDGANTVYKLSAPTTKIATPYTSPQIVSPYGTEEYISETICPVGHITEYPDNLREKLDGLPWDLSMIAPVETAYTATRNYVTGQLLIVDNTLYKVTSNIANNGTITPNSNVTATTLSEVILALA